MTVRFPIIASSTEKGPSAVNSMPPSAEADIDGAESLVPKNMVPVFTVNVSIKPLLKARVEDPISIVPLAFGSIEPVTVKSFNDTSFIKVLLPAIV